MHPNLPRPGGGTIAAGNRNSPPGRLRQTGIVELRSSVALGSTLGFVQCTISRALPFHAPSHHAPSPHAPFLCLRQHLSLLMLCNYFWVLCWTVLLREYNATARDPPRTPDWAPFLGFWSPFFIIFAPFSEIDFFYGFLMILPPFF